MRHAGRKALVCARRARHLCLPPALPASRCTGVFSRFCAPHPTLLHAAARRSCRPLPPRTFAAVCSHRARHSASSSTVVDLTTCVKAQFSTRISGRERPWPHMVKQRRKMYVVIGAGGTLHKMFTRGARGVPYGSPRQTFGDGRRARGDGRMAGAGAWKLVINTINIFK